VKLFILGAVGFASGLPYLLVGSTLSAWLTLAGVDIAQVTLLSLVTVPYSAKLLWAPLLDRFRPPLGGRRRGWMVPAQLGISILLWAMGGTREPLRLAALALACASLSATNDILSDAYQTDLLDPGERGPGASAVVFGYRCAMLIAGGLLLGLSEKFPFGLLYHGMALLMLPFTLVTALAPEPPTSASPSSLRQSIVDPLRDFFARPRALTTLAFLFLYRLGDTVVSTVANPFLLQRGYSAAEIGAVNQALGIAATIAGSLAGGVLVARAGLFRSLFACGFLAAVTNLGYSALAFVPRTHVGLVTVVAIDNLCSGLTVAATVTLIMSLCDRRFSATQFALLTSVAGLGGRLVAGGSGWLAARIGWGPFFVATLLPAVPALWLLTRLPRAAPQSAR
jgi:PAT family beta-lactamase induction signal transducer AmpG